MNRRELLAALGGLSGGLALGLPGSALAQAGGNVSRIVVPFAPGGAREAPARAIHNELGAETGQTWIIEAKPGAGGAIGTVAVARAEPDGRTLLMAASSHFVTAAMGATPNYDPVKDFQVVANLGDQNYILLVSGELPVRTVAEFIALAKKEPGKYSYGAQSSSIYLATELFNTRTGIKMTHVPYKGTAPAMNDLMGGHIDFLLGSISAMVPMLNSGKVRALTVTAPTRNDSAKTIPSYTEFGIKDMTMTSWVVIMAPAGTPQSVIDTLNAAINKTVDSPDVIKSLMQDGVMPQTGTPAMAAAFIKKETEQWKAIAKQVGMTPGGF